MLLSFNLESGGLSKTLFSFLTVVCEKELTFCNLKKENANTMTLLMELNSSRANTHISVASSAGDTMEDIMNTRCQSLMMNV